MTSASGWCGLTAYRDPIANVSDDGRFAISVTTPTATGVRFEGSCGVFDLFKFGPGLSQLFSGQTFGFGSGSAEPGLLRAYAAATAVIDPTEYDAGVIGTNPYRARTLFGSAAGFADVFVPPPASGAPNAGDPTTLKAALHLDCVENASSLVNSGIYVAAYTPDAFAADDLPYASVGYQTDLGGGGHTGCPIDTSAFPKVIAVTVGTPVVVAVGIGVTVATPVTSLAFPEFTLYSNALNTGTLVLTTADDVPLTGQTGKVYSVPGALPTVTTSSTVTTTSSAPPTTTTLAGCAGTCGDGAVDAACGEACDCAATADPIQAAYGCDGSTIQPPQAECVTCRGCQLLPVRCEVVTTTTIGTGNTTTTTLPGGCIGLAGIAAARCAIDAFLAEPLCLDAPAKRKIEAGVRRKLGAVGKALGRALTAEGKKRARLQRKAMKKLAAVGRRADVLGGKKLSDACATRIAGLVERIAPLIEGS
jgi:hypothetical protein